MVLPDSTVCAATVRDWPKAFRFSRPRRCFRCVSATVKLVANMDAVILWQSAQLQMKQPTRPGPWVGWGVGDGIRTEQIDEQTQMPKLTNASCTAPQKQV